MEHWQFYAHRFCAREKPHEGEAHNDRILEEEAESRKTRGLFLRKKAVDCVEAYYVSIWLSF